MKEENVLDVYCAVYTELAVVAEIVVSVVAVKDTIPLVLEPERVTGIVDKLVVDGI